MEVKFELKIESGNSAFVEAPNHETARILRQIAATIESGGSYIDGCARDINGNSVGGWFFSANADSDD